ncbi:hypothetical protein M569_15130 [Genlisea aurea]|uniref:Uncharacterized protein n=1 Tax=Genlisea aurea TaxID=192259 RepID=S8C5G0_9LAMI|nr:hypothetical protein M569_15130 [Genlisea aurea]
MASAIPTTSRLSVVKFPSRSLPPRVCLLRVKPSLLHSQGGKDGRSECGNIPDEEKVKEKTEEMGERAKDYGREAKEKMEEKADEAKEKMEEKGDEAKESAESIGEKAKKSMHDAWEKMKEVVGGQEEEEEDRHRKDE